LHRTLRSRAAHAGMSLSDYLRTELELVAERLPLAEIRYRLAALDPATVKETPAKAVRFERDRR
jgi:antitoxin FitA